MQEYYKIQIKDLPLHDVSKRLTSYKSILRQELRDHGIRFDFHLWVSDEWFCPDGVPGFALPFYLFNEDLMKIHKKETGLVEGRTDREILMLMRHELGHAIDNAFALRKDSQRQQVFGSSKEKYPDEYSPRRYSKNYIHYLGDNYAQSHPDEDFAETFAYWLDPHKSWRLKSLSKRVREKLELMDRLMKDVRHKKTYLKNKFCVESVEKNSVTLSHHYKGLKKQKKAKSYGRVDHNLMSAFSKSARKNCVSLAQYLKSQRKTQCRQISQSEGVYQYEADLALKKIIERAESLAIKAPIRELRLKSPTLIERNFRYLKERDQLKLYL